MFCQCDGGPRYTIYHTIRRKRSPILGFKRPLLQELSVALVDVTEIAQLIYKLYGLTDDEIAIVAN